MTVALTVATVVLGAAATHAGSRPGRRSVPGSEAGFWRSAGLAGVDAFGVYRTGPGGVRLAFFLRDTGKDGHRPAVRLVFTAPGRPDSVRLAALRPGPKRRWRTVRSANTGHLYAQECLGRWRGRTFQVGRCGGWRRRY